MPHSGIFRADFKAGMTNTVSYIAAFGGGVASSSVSPCVLPIVPGYLSVLTGLDLSDAVQGSRHHLLRITRDTALFVVGFTAVFVLAGRHRHDDRQRSVSRQGAVVADFRCSRRGDVLVLGWIACAEAAGLVPGVQVSPETGAIRALRSPDRRCSVRVRLATLPRADPRLGERGRGDGGFGRAWGGTLGCLLAWPGDPVSRRRPGTRPVVGHLLSFRRHSRFITIVSVVVMGVFGALLFTDRLTEVTSWLETLMRWIGLGRLITLG